MKQERNKAWGRQTAAMCDWASLRVEPKLRRLLQRLQWVVLLMSVALAAGGPALWLPITMPDVWAVSPQGTSHFLPKLDIEVKLP
ncbi:MAG: hypothetical protein N2690_08440 [Rhodocyclaceae bacterium]|nr:hypothetical protein [Rhodocyclaceae bacterium]